MPIREGAPRHEHVAVVVRWRREAFDNGAEPAVPRRHIVLVSAASAWEICTKVRIGKLPTGHDLCENFLSIITAHQLEQLAITVEHGRLAGRMLGTHKDPFDRILAAQAFVEDVPLVTNDPAFEAFGVKVVW